MSQERTDAIDQAETVEPHPLCPNCLAENEPRAYFCCKCNTPLTSFAEIDPIMRIHSMGDTVRKAASNPGKIIVLIGMWFVFGVPLVVRTTLYLSAKSFKPSAMEIAELTVAALAFLLVTAILTKVTANYFRARKKQNVHSTH